MITTREAYKTEAGQGMSAKIYSVCWVLDIVEIWAGSAQACDSHTHNMAAYVNDID